MNTTFLTKIILITVCILTLSMVALAQQSLLPPGLIQYKDSMKTNIFLDLKNAQKGILRYREYGQDRFQRVPLGQVVEVQLYPFADGALKQTFVVRSQKINGQDQLILVEQLLAGSYNLLAELDAEDPFYWENPDGEIIRIPASKQKRKVLLNQLLEQHGLEHHNKTVYPYRAKPLRRLTAYLNSTEQQKFPGFYFKGKLEYLRKTWNFTRTNTSLSLPIVFNTPQRANLMAIQGQASNIIALSALFEAPFYRNNNLTFIQEIGLRKEVTSVDVASKSVVLDLNMDASFITGAVGIKYSHIEGKHFPFVRAGLGVSVLLSESNRMTRTEITNRGETTRTTHDEIVSNVTLHPGLRAGTEFYLKGSYILTVGVTYTREMMLFRSISSSSNALGGYVAVNFY